jgi:hypothetical protein
MAKSIKKNKELGGVSMLSVMFFVLFLSILAVSFLRITNDEKQRSLRNELSTAALSAAEAGVEDAKRVLLYCLSSVERASEDACQKLDSDSSDACTNIIDNFSGLPQIIRKDANNNDAVVDTEGEPTYQQYYTCLLINRYTSDVELALPALDSKALDSSASVVVPLSVVHRGAGNTYHSSGITLSEFTVQWHLVGGEQSYDGGFGTLLEADKVNNPTKDAWNGPAMMRIEIVGVAKGSSFTADEVNKAAYAVILRPVTSDSNNDDYTSKTLNLATFASKNDPNASVSPIQNVKCFKGATNTAGYQCAARIAVSGGASAYASGLQLDDFDYYVRLTSLYRDSHASIANLQGNYSGSPAVGDSLVFNAVQPTIDVTGRVNNTYRRLIARVAPNASLAGDLFFPEYAIESGSNICKKMVVDADGTNSIDVCTYN